MRPLEWVLAQYVRAVTLLCPTLCDPVSCSLPGSSVHRIIPARILERVTISYSKSNMPGVLIRRENVDTGKDTRDAYTQRKDPMKIQPPVSLRRNQPCRHLDLGLPASRWRDSTLLFKSPSLRYFVVVALTNQNTFIKSVLSWLP